MKGTVCRRTAHVRSYLNILKAPARASTAKSTSVRSTRSSSTTSASSSYCRSHNICPTSTILSEGFSWVQSSGGNIPQGAIAGGRENDSRGALYIARGWFHGARDSGGSWDPQRTSLRQSPRSPATHCVDDGEQRSARPARTWAAAPSPSTTRRPLCVIAEGLRRDAADSLLRSATWRCLSATPTASAGSLRTARWTRAGSTATLSCTSLDDPICACIDVSWHEAAASTQTAPSFMPLVHRMPAVFSASCPTPELAVDRVFQSRQSRGQFLASVQPRLCFSRT